MIRLAYMMLSLLQVNSKCYDFRCLKMRRMCERGLPNQNSEISRYDFSQELYDMRKDPNEWNNLAHDSKYAEVIAQHKKYLPKENRMPAPGSRSRILTYKDGKVIWQGEEVKPNDPIPGLE